jgi:hypothetical protein
MYAANPVAPWRNASSSIACSRDRCSSTPSTASSAVPAATDATADAGSWVKGASISAMVETAAAGSSLMASLIARYSSGTHGTSSSGAGVATNATDRTRSGWRGARARATRPPADHPTAATSSTPNDESTAAASSANRVMVGTSPGASGVEPPYPGRSRPISRTLAAAVASGSGSNRREPGAAWRKSTGRPSSRP